jgi:hypothetical protein
MVLQTDGTPAYRKVSGSQVAAILSEMLSRETPAQVTFAASPGQMLHDGFYAAKSQAATISTLTAEDYDEVVLMDSPTDQENYPEYHYNGVSAHAAAAKRGTKARVHLLIPSARALEVGHRVALGTHSHPIPAGPFLDSLNSLNVANSETAFGIAASLFTALTGHRAQAAELSAQALGTISAARAEELCQSAHLSIEDQKGHTHYSDLWEGAVKIHGATLSPGSQFKAIYAGTSTENAWSTYGRPVITAAGYGGGTSPVAKSSSSRAFISDSVTQSLALIAANPGTYRIAFARAWEVSPKPLTDAEPQLQCQIYSKVEPHWTINGQATIGSSELVSNSLFNYWDVVQKYAKAKQYNLAYIPLYEAIARYRVNWPDVALRSDSQHLNAPFLYLLIAMSFTARTGQQAPPPATVVDAPSKAAFVEGYKIIRQFSTLSDSGEYVPFKPVSNSPPSFTTQASAQLDASQLTKVNLLVAAQDDAPLQGLTFTWSLLSGPSTDPIFSKNETFDAGSTQVTLSRAGLYRIRVTVADAWNDQVSTEVEIDVPAVPSAVRIDPAASVMVPGLSSRFSAVVYDQFGHPLSSQPAFAWSLEGGGTLGADGVFSPGATAGPRSITASALGLSDTWLGVVNHAGAYDWSGAVSKDWLEPANWTPTGFINGPNVFGTISSGTATANATTCNASIIVAGVEGLGGTLQTGTAVTFANGAQLYMAGGLLHKTSGSTLNITGNLTAVNGTLSEIRSDSAILRIFGSILGSGTLRITGTQPVGLTGATITAFTGNLDIKGGKLEARSGNITYSDLVKTEVRDGGSLLRGLGTASLKMKGGITLNSGNYVESGSGTTWSADTPWTIQSNASFQTGGTDGFVKLLGPLSGNGTLRVLRSGTAQPPLVLEGQTSSYTGKIEVESTGLLYLGSSGALPIEGTLASLEIKQAAGLSGALIVGASYGPSLLDRPGVSALVRTLSIGGTPIRAGLYNQSNQSELGGAILFNNGSSSLRVMEPVLQRIRTSAGIGGSLSVVGGELVAPGGSAEIQASSNPGYVLTNVNVNGLRRGALPTISYSSIGSDLNVEAAFAIDSNSNQIPDEWEQENFGTLLANPESDPDRDGFSCRQEFSAGTGPLNAESYPKLSIRTDEGRPTLHFPSHSERFYTVEESLSLSSAESWRPLRDEIPGDGNFLEVTAGSATPRAFYRLRIRP